MKYTVLILRPDYVASNYGQDTFLAHVDAPDVGTAEHDARVEAFNADTPPDERNGETDAWGDYHVLFVAEGHHNDLRSE